MNVATHNAAQILAHHGLRPLSRVPVPPAAGAPPHFGKGIFGTDLSAGAGQQAPDAEPPETGSMRKASRALDALLWGSERIKYLEREADRLRARIDVLQDTIVRLSNSGRPGCSSDSYGTQAVSMEQAAKDLAAVLSGEVLHGDTVAQVREAILLAREEKNLPATATQLMRQAYHDELRVTSATAEARAAAEEAADRHASTHAEAPATAEEQGARAEKSVNYESAM